MQQEQISNGMGSVWQTSDADAKTAEERVDCTVQGQLSTTKTYTVPIEPRHTAMVAGKLVCIEPTGANHPFTPPHL